ncbi:type II toxin-antitoxin system Phd/YefM family antitoxin [Solihabitans fulvus]|uniref:Antitoxin n=1 Tax=Solihabitans fulvus TaxID=1892852 RepID=A0A5B2WYP0_9PSEU|nr:type II toxin-antitoxin system Phd/YefM family antitoxin [Solihabitans fulvus]KAA2256721.1 type II toxin-antitoxin system Phd/YefM family antitoxin [Solihabitans fulvus]
MRIITASDASRRFSAVLDEAEHGETIVVTRGGRRVAVISPAPSANGAALLAFSRHWAGELDEDFAKDVAAARSAVELDGDPWASA